MRWVARCSATLLSQSIWSSSSGGVVVGVEGDEGGAQPRLVAVDGGGEGLAEVSVVDAGERFVGVGSPGLLAQGGVDLGVLDDVGPVLEDPVLAGLAGVAGVGG